MQSYFKGFYDEDLACSLYLEYEDFRDSEVLDELIAQLCPLIRLTLRTQIGPKYRCHQEFLESNALHDVYRVVSDAELPHHPRAFTCFLQTVIRRALLDSLREVKPQIFEYWKVCRSPAPSDLLSQADAERQLYSQQRRRLLRERVRSRVRFIGEERDACFLIADSKLGFKSFDVKVVRRRFNLSPQRSRYLEKYVGILLKAELLEEHA